MLLIYSALSIDDHNAKLHSVWLNFPRDGRYTSHSGGMKTSAFFKLQLIAARSGGGLAPRNGSSRLINPSSQDTYQCCFLIDWVRKIQIKHSFVPRAAARACNFTQQRVHWWVCIVNLNQPLAPSEMILGKHNLWGGETKNLTNFSELLESERWNHRLHL